MRALRSHSAKSDSGSNKSNTEKVIKKGKRNKSSKKTCKRNAQVSIESTGTTENEIFTESSPLTDLTDYNKESNESKYVTKLKRSTRHSRNVTKDVLTEYVSPNAKETCVSEMNDMIKESPEKVKKNKKGRRNGGCTSEESVEFKNSVTPTALNKKRTRQSIIQDSFDEQKFENNVRLSRKLCSVNRSQNFDVTETRNESNIRDKKRTSLSGAIEEIRDSPTFKNIVTSTTIKPKKRKQCNIEEWKSTNNSNDKEESNVTDVLNSTYLKIDEDCRSIVSTNNSGQWEIEEQKEKSIILIGDDTNRKMFECPSEIDNKDVKKVLFQEKCLNKSARKKWERFPRNSQGANSILEQISTPQKKSLNTSEKLNKTEKTTTTSGNKIKRTAMPNFALIHQKAYEKMESISEYSQRKKDRANLLLSNKKVETKENERTEMKIIKSSRQLFSNEKPDTSKMKFNRFGFKLTNKPLAAVNPVKSLKPSIYDREQLLAIANKKMQNTGNLRENKRDLLKGVRTNRRFELLMKMRNN